MSPYDLHDEDCEAGYNGVVSNVIPFPVTIDSLTRQLLIIEQENAVLQQKVEQLGRELEDLRSELIASELERLALLEG